MQTHPHLQALRYETKISSVAEWTLQRTQSGRPTVHRMLVLPLRVTQA